MKKMLKQAFYNGTLRRISFWIGFLLLAGGFLLIPMFDLTSIFSSLSITLMLTGFFFQIVTYLLPSPKLRQPGFSLKKGSDAYLDQSPEDLSSEQREALLQESWMVAADRFLRIRKF